MESHDIELERRAQESTVTDMSRTCRRKSYDFCDGKKGAIQLADKSEMKKDNGSHGEQSWARRREHIYPFELIAS